MDKLYRIVRNIYEKILRFRIKSITNEIGNYERMLKEEERLSIRLLEACHSPAPFAGKPYTFLDANLNNQAQTYLKLRINGLNKQKSELSQKLGV